MVSPRRIRGAVPARLPAVFCGRIVGDMIYRRPHRWLLVAVLASGCGITGIGFTDSEFVGKNSGYGISYAEPAKWLVAPDDWDLDNYDFDRKGKPRREKNLGIYRDSIDWVDASGRSENLEYVIYDLKFRHGNGSILAVSTVAVPSRLRNLRLSTFAEEWANSYNGMQFSFKRGEGRRMASKIIESKAREVGGRVAREVTFDVVDVDQLQLDPQAPRTRIRATFVQAPLVKEFLGSGFAPPAFLFVAYLSDEKKFDKLVGDYEGLLARIHFGKQ
jgi:hypothetical protein